MISSQNDLFKIQLGVSEEDYLDMIKESIKDEEKQKRFLEVFNHLSKQEKETIRTIIPLSLIGDEDDMIKFLFAIQALDPKFLEETVKRFRDRYKENE